MKYDLDYLLEVARNFEMAYKNILGISNDFNLLSEIKKVKLDEAKKNYLLQHNHFKHF